MRQLLKALISMVCGMIDILAAIVSSAAVIVIAACLYIGARERLTGELTFVAGYKPVYIESGSMEPTIKTGSIVLLNECVYEDIEAGDIITFDTDRGYVTHRYLGLDYAALKSGEAAYLITKGDANDIEDPERLEPGKILGKVVVD